MCGVRYGTCSLLAVQYDVSVNSRFSSMSVQTLFTMIYVWCPKRDTCILESRAYIIVIYIKVLNRMPDKHVETLFFRINERCKVCTFPPKNYNIYQTSTYI